jgi:drug/metabolite transporter (DMT)-like permease
LTLATFLVVLFAALLHAGWNGLVKNAGDKYLGMSAVVVGHFPFACIAVVSSPLPDPSSWSYIVAGAGLHIGYQLFLLRSYQAGDLSHVYPIARGIAPILVAFVSVLLLGEQLTTTGTIAVLAIAAGITSLVFVRGSDGLRNRHAAMLALVTGCFIAAYSLVDGYGARLAQTAFGFFGWLSAINTIGFLLLTAFFRPATLRKVANDGLFIALAGGGASFVAYSLVVWAFTQAPIALVTALRESSIIFAMIIGVIFLKERLSLGKVFSTALTAFGVVLMRITR